MSSKYIGIQLITVFEFRSNLRASIMAYLLEAMVTLAQWLTKPSQLTFAIYMAEGATQNVRRMISRISFAM